MEGGGLLAHTPRLFLTAGSSLSWPFYCGVGFHRSRVDVCYAPLVLQRRCQARLHWRNKFIILLFSNIYMIIPD
jgi:hypothetical protein